MIVTLIHAKTLKPLQTLNTTMTVPEKDDVLVINGRLFVVLQRTFVIDDIADPMNIGQTAVNVTVQLMVIDVKPKEQGGK